MAPVYSPHSVITGWAVALTCYISHSAKHRKTADFDPSGSQNSVNRFWRNLAWLTTSGTPPHMTTLLGVAERGWSGQICDWSHLWVSFLFTIRTVIAVFTALHAMQMRSSDENSVRLSVPHTRALWQNGRKIFPDLYTVRKNIYPSILRRMVGGGRPLLREILGQPTPVGTKSPIFNQ